MTVGGTSNVMMGSTPILVCRASGIDITMVTSLYTWFHNGVKIQSESASNDLSTGTVQVSNAGDEYTCEVKVKASYWNVSGSFRSRGSAILSVSSNKHHLCIAIIYTAALPYSL